MKHEGPFDKDGLHVISENGSITTYCACERDRRLIEEMEASA